MKRSQKAMLAAGMLVGVAAMTGCAANTTPVATPTPQVQQETAAPATAQPTTQPTAQPQDAATPEAEGEESPGPIPLSVAGKALKQQALQESGFLLLPLEATAEALGWQTDAQESQEETQTRRTVTLEKEQSRITVSWLSSDNTARQITWQKDGLLVPVDTRLTSVDDVIYVPAAFFEAAMDAQVSQSAKGVAVEPPEPKNTPPNDAQQDGDDAQRDGNDAQQGA